MSEAAEIVARLASPEAGVRRLAIHDLIARSAREPGLNDVLLGHLSEESDEKAALLVIRHAARSGLRHAIPMLLALYQDARTPVRIAMAAIRAHDAMAADQP